MPSPGLGSPLGPDFPPDGYIDIGSDHWYVKVVDSGGELMGIIDYHLNADGNLCGGMVYFKKVEDRPQWTVNSLDPLDISPSIHCHPDKGGCGSHGFIRNGRWTNA